MTQQHLPTFSRRLVASLAIAAVALSPALPASAAPGPAAGTSAEAPSAAAAVDLDLSGTWKFATGDDPAFAAPGFDDSAWTDLQVP